MAGNDRRLRQQLETAGEVGDGYHHRMQAMHEANARRLREIISEHGWPGRSLVGEDGAEAAWFIVQHSISEPDFMREAAVLLQHSTAERNAPAWHLAFLTDRIAFYEGRPQRYGTQWDVDDDGTEVIWELESPERVDDLRREVGLPALSARFPGAQWRRILTRKPSAKRLRDFEEWARAIGWRKSTP